MLTKKEVSVLRQLAIFADINNVNKSDIARKTNTTAKTVRSIIKRFKECEINVRKS